jgi:hypothetical protein
VNEKATTCPKCSIERFCSKECEGKAKKYHSILCSPNTTAPVYQFEELFGDVDSKGGILASRIIALLIKEYNDGTLKYEKNESEEGFTLSGGSWDFLDCLERSDNVQDLDEIKLEDEYQFIDQIFQAYKAHILEPQNSFQKRKIKILLQSLTKVYLF